MRHRLQNLSNLQVLGILMFIVIVTSSLSIILEFASGAPDLTGWYNSWLQNFSTETFGAIATFLLFEQIIGNRQRKEKLLRDMRSSLKDIAIRAAEEMRSNGWLQDGSLKECKLREANLRGVNFESADLHGSDFREANLTGAVLSNADLHDTRMMQVDLEKASLEKANLCSAFLENANLQEAVLEHAHMNNCSLIGANLEKADLWRANLQGARLMVANLQCALLYEADLRGAYLYRAHLQGASLWQANLTGTHQLDDARFDTNTTLPDGTKWSAEVDLTRFTDPRHPHYWQPEVHPEEAPSGTPKRN